jgi:hypothetical protein
MSGPARAKSVMSARCSASGRRSGRAPRRGAGCAGRHGPDYRLRHGRGGSARARSGCCDFYRRTCPGLRSSTSCPSGRARSARTFAASTPNSRSVTGPRRCSAQGSYGCCRPPYRLARRSPDPGDAGHLTVPDRGGIDQAPALYTINGHLGATALSPVPGHGRIITARTPCSPACWTGRHCTACWPRSRRSARPGPARGPPAHTAPRITGIR